VRVIPEGLRDPKLIGSLKQCAAGNNQFLRASSSPFRDEATPAHLASQGRKTLIIAGFATEVVVLHAALDALGRDYGVVVVVDACGGMSERTENAALAQFGIAAGSSPRWFRWLQR
jgi:nicotinamidase-related amidase